MHQNGIGLQKDNPLAKRYYDHGKFIKLNNEIKLINYSSNRSQHRGLPAMFIGAAVPGDWGLSEGTF